MRCFFTENNENNKIQNSHTMILDNRKLLNLSGITNVDSFSDQKVSVHTINEVLNIEGEKLKISKFNLNTGQLILEGKINSVTYSFLKTAPEKNKNNGNFFSKLFD
ncbi:MAG: sporulation protein YabP [Candidatus Paraimprobicoccus trichonymphae]|uniref:Sporulation protein YabP n=1 Tax=Candidatus Paraimprobicoccus trichonymphae TaxID=3033793 RepID=A0AA48IBQ0_9FIRM|nr:MAG: sporulation protein YabP [Candidatus Paraimprobicoccus trichonymphae]